MLTLSYGFKKPQAPDKGNVFFPALEGDIQQLNDHTHNGIDSPPIPAQNISKSTQSIAAVNWIVNGNRFRQLVTLPAGFAHVTTIKTFRVSGGTYDGEEIYPSVEKGPAGNQYYVYVNDNTLDLTALYV